jgi:hypothetical protein
MSSLADAVLKSKLIESAAQRGTIVMDQEKIRDKGLEEFIGDGRQILIAFGHDRQAHHMRRAVIERVRSALETVGADEIELSENERSWVWVGRCDKAGAAEAIRTAVWLKTST